MRHAREDYQGIQDRHGRIPDDEPVFVLRAQDATAAAVVRFWASLQQPGELKDMALVQADEMDRWPVKKIADGPHTTG